MGFVTNSQLKQVEQTFVDNLKTGVLKPSHANVADNLSPYSEDSGTIQENPFISQGTGTDNNSVIVTTGAIARQLEKQGNTVVKNQIFYPKSSATTASGVTATYDASTNRFHIVGTASSNSYALFLSAQAITFVTGYKYLLKSTVVGTKASGYVGAYVSNAINLQDSNGNGVIGTPTANTSAQVWFFIKEGETYDCYVSLYISNITNWFGGNDKIPSDLLTNPSHFSWYYNGSLAYDVGSLQNCNGRYLECGQGRNLLNPNAIVSNKRIVSDGSFIDDSNYSITDYILIIPNKPVYFRNVSNNANRISCAFYDKDKNFVSTYGLYVSGGADPVSGYTTAPANAQYVVACIPNAYKNDSDVSLYYTEQEGGEGYNQHYDYVAPIRIDTGNEPLLGVDGSRDVKLPSGLITRVRKRYTFTGNETWEWIESWGGFRTFAITDALSVNGNTGEGCTALLPGYEEKPQYSTEANKTNMTFVLNSGYHTTNALGIINTAYGKSDLDAFKAYIAGKTIEYPLATPTTEQGTAFSEYADINDYSYMAWFDTDGNLVSIPQGCKLFYPVDYKGWIDDGVMYTNGDVTSLAKNESITDTALNARGYYKMQDLLTFFNKSIGGTLRQALCQKVTLDFGDTDYKDLGTMTWVKDGTRFISNDLDGFVEAKTFSPIICTDIRSKASGEAKGIWVGQAAYSSNKTSICVDGYSDVGTADQFKAFVNGVLIAYKKA